MFPWIPDTLIEYALKLLPIGLGAAIGFVTNVVAIRMLFRPLKEYRIFGIRVPLTPGIIPRQRGQLAVSIGRMVSGKLLNADAVIQHLRSPGFHSSLIKGMNELESGKTQFQDAYHPLAVTAGKTIRSIATREGVSEILSVVGNSLGDLSLHSIVPKAFLNGVLKDLVDRHVVGGFGPKLVINVTHLTQRLVEENRNIEAVLTLEVRQALQRIFESIYNPGTEFFVNWLSRPEIRKELNVRGKQILSDILRQLTSVQRFFLSAGQYNRTLEERMPEIISDLLETLRQALANPQNREKLLVALGEMVEIIAKTPLKELEDRLETDLAGLVKRGGEALLVVLQKEQAGKRFEILIHRFLKRHGKIRINSFMRLITGSSTGELALKLGETVSVWIAVPGNVEGIVNRFLIGSQEDIAQSIGKILERVVPEAVQRLDIQALVENRINSLDVLEVERLLLSIMAKHFKWINLFGALLGGFIGALQLLPRVPW